MNLNARERIENVHFVQTPGRPDTAKASSFSNIIRHCNKRLLVFPKNKGSSCRERFFGPCAENAQTLCTRCTKRIQWPFYSAVQVPPASFEKVIPYQLFFFQMKKNSNQVGRLTYERSAYDFHWTYNELGIPD